MTFKTLAAAALAGAMLAAPAWAQKAAPSANPIHVSEAWIREAPAGAKAMAGYLVIENKTDRPLVLSGASSPYFHEVQMHVTFQEKGMTGMRPVPRFTIPAGEKLELRPGGSHLMLMNPTRTLPLGAKVPLTLDFGKDGKATHEVVVRSAREMRGKVKPAASPAAEHQHEHEHHNH